MLDSIIRTKHQKMRVLVIGCSMGGSPGDVSEDPVTLEKRKKGWRMSCDVGEVTERFENA